MSGAGVIFEDILNDTLLLGSLAAEIFVKNPASQATAGRVVSAVAQLLQVINAQVNSPTASAATQTSSISTGVTAPTPSAS